MLSLNMGGKISVNEEIYVHNMYGSRKEKFKVLGIKKEGVDINTADIGEKVVISITEVDNTTLPYFVMKGDILRKEETPEPLQKTAPNALIYIYTAAEGGNGQILENELNITYLFKDEYKIQVENPIQPGTSGKGRVVHKDINVVRLVLYFTNDYYYIFVEGIVVGIFVLLP